jgi:hypothetical protein
MAQNLELQPAPAHALLDAIHTFLSQKMVPALVPAVSVAPSARPRTIQSGPPTPLEWLSTSHLRGLHKRLFDSLLNSGASPRLPGREPSPVSVEVNIPELLAVTYSIPLVQDVPVELKNALSEVSKCLVDAEPYIQGLV